MTKLYKKSDLTFKNGIVVDDDGNVIGLPAQVAVGLEKIEVAIQKAEYLKSQPKAQPIPSLEGFKRKSALKPDIKIESETPTIDKMVEEAKTLHKEMKLSMGTDKLNGIIEKFPEVFRFTEDDSFVGEEHGTALDLPTLGNPLELTSDQLLQHITEVLDIIKL